MLTVHDATGNLLEAIKAGAQAYLVKNIRSARLLDQPRGLKQGEATITRRIAARILEEFQPAQATFGAPAERTSCPAEALRAPRKIRPGWRYLPPWSGLPSGVVGAWSGSDSGHPACRSACEHLPAVGDHIGEDRIADTA